MRLWRHILVVGLLVLVNDHTFQLPSGRRPAATMPLVIPDVSSTSGSVKSEEQWSTLLKDKVVTDNEHSETVHRYPHLPESDWTSDRSRPPQNFCKKDLPDGCRVLGPGARATRDHVEDRLNVHVNDEGKVTHVNKG